MNEVYRRIREGLTIYLSAYLKRPTLTRLALLVTGVVQARSAAPARIAQAVSVLGLFPATAQSLERRIRRCQNDPSLEVHGCLVPLVRSVLEQALAKQTDGSGKDAPPLILVLDPTTQDDRLVMVPVGLWYRGRTLPLAWAIWEGNTPLRGPRFWERMAALLEDVAQVLPEGIEKRRPVILLADRAFGCTAFTDLVRARGWHFVVRVQGTTLARDGSGRVRQIGRLVPHAGGRLKFGGQVFKKQGWRWASVVVLWGRRWSEPLCLVSDLPPRWEWLALYRRRFGIECSFRDLKSSGRQWEQGQVRDIEHVQRLLVAVALATWLTMSVGAWMGAQLLAQARPRRGRPEATKYSLFTLGLQTFSVWLMGAGGRHGLRVPDDPLWRLLPQMLEHAPAMTWKQELWGRCLHHYIFAGATR